MIPSLPPVLQGLLIDTLRLCVWLAILSALFVPLERLFALRPARWLRKELGLDLACYFLNSLLPAFLLGFPLALLAWAVHRLVPSELHAAIGSLPFWARALAAFAVGDFGYYWGHRLSHAVPALWRLHAVHHAAEHIDFLVNTRAHPLDMMFGRLCGLIPLYVLGLSGPAARATAGEMTGSLLPLLVVLAGTGWSFFIHANLRWRLGPLEYAISTPAFHHWHHNRANPVDRNFASLLPAFDWMFGTLHLPQRAWPARYGVAEPMPAALWRRLLEPLLPPRATRANVP